MEQGRRWLGGFRLEESIKNLRIPQLCELSRLVISHAARVATSIDVHKPHLASYKQWLIQQHTPNLGDTDTAALSQPIETLMKVLEVTPAARAALAITAISNSMEAVLEREKTGWEVMNDNGSLNSLTAFLQEHDDSEYIWSIAHTKLKMSVLEPLYSQLVVTDESLNNLNAIKEDFKGVPRVKFSVLDVSGSLAEQGFENQQFDLIIATHAISTGNDIQASLRTLHQLLRPNGRLILRVPRPGLLWAKFALGTQPDWWSHAEDMSRIEEPFLSTEKWNDDNDLEMSANMADMGLDSLVAIETRAWWKLTFGLWIGFCCGLKSSNDGLREPGPFGLEVAICLARMGLSFRIIGRADGLQPRAVEHLHAWGLSSEFTEEGPLLDSTVLFRNGVKLVHDANLQCDSRYRGSHIITQGQIEKIYIRDLRRHGLLVERGVVAEGIHVQKTSEQDIDAWPVSVTLRDVRTGSTENVRAKYLVGADGAASATREMLGIPFDGLTTDCYWAIMDCQFKTDFPYILGFCIVISEEHGGVIIIPREDGYTRFYTQITGDKARQLSEKRNGRRNASAVGATRIDDHGITADEVLEQLNKIMAPWKVEFASAMINERVARAFSTPDQRAHIGGDAAVFGAFGLNSSIYDAANLSWKLGLSIQGAARPEILLPTYDSERRVFANRVIRVSGAYLRFVCNTKQPLAQLRGLGDELEVHQEDLPVLDGTTEADQHFLRSFFGRNQQFLLGVEDPIVESAICPRTPHLPPTKVSHHLLACITGSAYQVPVSVSVLPLVAISTMPCSASPASTFFSSHQTCKQSCVRTSSASLETR
ncbi:hypothetical protein CFE70_000194 [Pyrenophora teres f. teres 0-1]